MILQQQPLRQPIMGFIVSFVIILTLPAIVGLLWLSYLEQVNTRKVNCFYYQQEKFIPTTNLPKGRYVDRYVERKELKQ